MQCVHSSSALGVNIFQYWRKINQVPFIVTACRFCNKVSNVSKEIDFEEKRHIKGVTGNPPNIDIIINNSEDAKYKLFAIECKFSEAYRNEQKKLKAKYLEVQEIWADIPNLHSFAKKINKDVRDFQYLDPAQLVRHIFSLK